MEELKRKQKKVKHEKKQKVWLYEQDALNI